MEEKELIRVGHQTFIVENEKLVDARNKQEEKNLIYGCYKDYINPHIRYVIVNQQFWIWFENRKQAKDIKTSLLCQGRYFSYYVTEQIGSEENSICVFALKENGKVSLLGRTFETICDTLLKIGNFVYQQIDGDLEMLCACQDFEVFDSRVEINTGEKDYSEMHVFQFTGHCWKEIMHWRPGNIVPQQMSNI